MAEQVRVGMVSTSGWADRFLLPGFESHPQAQVVAICGRNRDRAEAMAKKHDIPQVFTDYRAMIERGNLQAINIASPDDAHYAMTMDALDAGLHVLCEKPLALKAEHARVMYQKAEAMGVKHMVFLTWRWMPQHRYLRQLVAEGYIGRCFQAHFRILTGYGRRVEYGWRFDRRRANGIVSDLGSHMIDLARWCIGDIAKVNAHLTTFIERPGVGDQPLDPANDAAHLGLEFENGSQGVIQANSVAYLGETWVVQQIALHGEAGTLMADLRLDDPRRGGADARMEVRGLRHDEPRLKTLPIPDQILGDVDPTNPIEVLTKQSVGARLFIDAIVEDRPVSPSFYDGLKAQEVVDAALESDRQGCWISIKSMQKESKSHNSHTPTKSTIVTTR